MFGLRVTIRPTAPLTFRRVPFSTLEMLTYPFVPPTTLSGYLDRLVRLSHNEELLETNNANLKFYTLPRAYHVVGALAAPDPVRSQQVLTTIRQGIRLFDHTAASQLKHNKRSSSERSKESYQLYRWEYLFAELLIGYILHEQEDALKLLSWVQNYGCKLGKEGWAFVDKVEGPFPLEQQRVRKKPSCLVPAADAFGSSTKMYPLYRYAWHDTDSWEHEPGRGPAPIQGFVPFLAAVVDDMAEMDYYVGNDAYIPVSMLEYF